MKHRILFFHHEFPGGGGERVTLDIATYLQSFDFETYVVTCNKKNDYAIPEVTIIELPCRKLNSRENSNVIINTINSLAIDIFIVPGFLLDDLEYIKENTKCKLVYVLHNVPFWEVIAKIERRKRTQGSILKMLEWYFLGYPKAILLNQYTRKYMKRYKEVYDLVDDYVVLCDAYKEQLVKTLKLPINNKVHVIHNSERKVSPVCLEKKNQVLFVGNLIYENKRVDRLLEIWNMVYKRLPDWELIVVGGGLELKSLQCQANKMHLERIFFVGGVKNAKSYYQEASVLCLTSTFEGWPLCLTEAQSYGVVPIAFNSCAGIEEILAPSGVNGILVPPFDKEKFAEELFGLLTCSERIRELRTNILLKSQNYSIEIVGPKWHTLFNQLLKRS